MIFLYTVQHTGSHWAMRILDHCGVDYVWCHTLTRPEKMDWREYVDYPTLVTLRHPAAQYASCVRRGKDVDKFSLLPWREMAKRIKAFRDVFMLRLEDPDFEGLVEWLGVDIDPETIPREPVNMSGPSPSRATGCPAELMWVASKLGY